MNKVNTGNKSLDRWIEFFNNKEKSNTRFVSLLKKYDKSFLTMSPPKTAEDLTFPDLGLMEEDFRKVAFNDEKSELLDEKSRIIMAGYYHVDLSPWKKKYGEKFFDVMERALIEGDYERYNIDFEKVVSLFIQKNYITRESFFDVSILRGVILGERYDSEDDVKSLNKNIRLNKIKTLFNI